MKNLALQFTGGKFYAMFFTPNSPLFHTGKLLVPMQEVSIKMYFNDPSVFMLSAAATDGAATKAKALSDDAIKITLNLCQVTVAPSLYRQITTARTRSTVMYPLHASKIRTFSMANGLTDFDQDQLFTNRVPVRVLVGLLHNSAFNGAPYFLRGVPQHSSPCTTRGGWTLWLYRQYRHARSTGQSLGSFVDRRRGVYGHGQFCHPVTHV